jgi:hypothetical protein
VRNGELLTIMEYGERVSLSCVYYSTVFRNPLLRVWQLMPSLPVLSAELGERPHGRCLSGVLRISDSVHARRVGLIFHLAPPTHRSHAALAAESFRWELMISH